MARLALSACFVAAAAAAATPCGGSGAAGCDVVHAKEEESALLQMGGARRAEATLLSSGAESGSGEGWPCCGYPSLAGLVFGFEYTRLFRTEGFDRPEYGHVDPLTVPLSFYGQLAEGGPEDAHGRFVSFHLPSSPSPNARNLTFICEFEERHRLACVEALSGRFFGHLTFDEKDLAENHCVPTKFDIAAAYGELLLHPFNNAILVHAIGAITGHGSATAVPIQPMDLVIDPIEVDVVVDPIPVDVVIDPIELHPIDPIPAEEGQECRRASKWLAGKPIIPCTAGLACVSWCPSGRGVCTKVQRKCDRLAVEGNYSLSLTTFSLPEGKQTIEEAELGAAFFNQLDGQGLPSDQGVYVQFVTSRALAQLGVTPYALCIQDESWAVRCVDAASGTPVWRFAADPERVDRETCSPSELEVVLYGAARNATGAFVASASRGVLRKPFRHESPTPLAVDDASEHAEGAGLLAESSEREAHELRAAGEGQGCHFRLESLAGRSYTWSTHTYISPTENPESVSVNRQLATVSFASAPEGFLVMTSTPSQEPAACVPQSRGVLLCADTKATYRFTVDWLGINLKTCAVRKIKEQSWGLLGESASTFISEGGLELTP